jgi:hypothetical protein
LNFIQITNNPDLAEYVSSSGVQNVMIDIESIGKNERQKNLDTLKSKHQLKDIIEVKNRIQKYNSKIITRINPFHKNSKFEVETSISFGTDYIMLPMFETVNEVEQIIDLIDNRVKLILLFETPKSLINIDSILELKKIDEAFIGLNDLSIALKLDFMFELLPSSLLEFIILKFKNRGIPFGIGGISRIGEGTLDSQLILSEHVRLGSTKVIISRSFTNKAENLGELIRNIDYKKEINLINDEYKKLKKSSFKKLELNHVIVKNKIQQIIK